MFNHVKVFTIVRMLLSKYIQKIDIPKRGCWEIQYKTQCKTFLYSAHSCYDFKNLCQLKYFILLQ